MKKTFKYFALAFMGVAAVSCSDDLISQGRPVAGDEIVFGASASIEAGDKLPDSKDSRTAYGDVSADGKSIAINWCAGDQLTIACPEAGGLNNAIYRIPLNGQTEGTDLKNPFSTVLERVSTGAGLQWGTAAQHNFYAVYPSPNVSTNLKLNVANGGAATVTGFMPASYKAVPTFANGTLTLEPDMKYAYMVAKTTVDAPQSGVSLKFEPIVTALEFEFAIGDIETSTDGTTPNVEVTGLALTHNKGQNIAGTFEYTYPVKVGDKGVVKNTAHTSSSTVFMNITSNEVFPLAKGNKCKATFFIVPSETGEVNDINPNDLSLNIQMKYAGSNRAFDKTATIGRGLTARKKYFVRNMTLPKIPVVNHFNWFSKLSPETYISQLSFPVAGHAFANKKNTVNDKWNREQVHDYQTLWNSGVRGFELRTAYNGIDAENFGTSKFVVGGKAVGNTTFDEAFSWLYKQLTENPNETLVLVCTYQSHDGDKGFNPDQYLLGLQNYLRNFATKKLKTIPDLFVKLGTNSTVQDLRGKIAVVIRLCDHDYVRFENKLKVTDLKLSSDFANYIAYVNDWGSSIDCWDKRFSNGNYYREGRFDNGTPGKSQIEKKLWMGKSQRDNAYVPLPINEENDPKLLGKFPSLNSKEEVSQESDYSYAVNGVTGGAMVQSWERVMPKLDNSSVKNGDHIVQYSGRSLWVLVLTEYLYFNWPESLTEKKAAIDYTLDESLKTRPKKEDLGQSTTQPTAGKLFINNLCGYFPYAGLKGSWDPYFKKGGLEMLGIKVEQVTGGDYASCAATLNHHFYQKIKALDETTAGPLGLVMFDYVGASDTDFPNMPKYQAASQGTYPTAAEAAEASQKLCTEIIQMNWKFTKLSKPKSKTTETQTNSSQSMEGDGNIITFK